MVDQLIVGGGLPGFQLVLQISGGPQMKQPPSGFRLPLADSVLDSLVGETVLQTISPDLLQQQFFAGQLMAEIGQLQRILLQDGRQRWEGCPVDKYRNQL